MPKNYCFVLYAVTSCILLSACQPSSGEDTASFRQHYISHLSVSDSLTVVATLVADSLEVPWDITWGPDGWLWFTEQRGTINRLHPESGERQLLLQLDDVHYEKSRGLLGMALHPDFNSEPYVYLVYTYHLPDAAIASRLMRYTYRHDTLSDPQVLLQGIPGNTYHNGARLIITSDRKILLSTGDAGHAEEAQNLNSLSGKLLRLNLDGSIPEDNPLPDSYIWSWGHRNPQGLAEAPDGKVYSSEHGPDNDDEVNLILKGSNYGWPDVMGYCDLPSEKTYCMDSGTVAPLMAWSPVIAPSGLTFYGATAIPSWKNTLLMGSLKNQALRVLHLNATGDSIVSAETFFPGVFGRIRDVCVSPAGDVYLSTSNRDWHPVYFPALYDTALLSSGDRIIRLHRASRQQAAWLDTASFARPQPVRTVQTAAAPDTSPAGTLYQQYCSGCHQQDGQGIEGLYPPLSGTDRVTGDPARLAQVVLQGLSGPLQVNGVTYDGQMPPYRFLPDEQLADILTYIRQHFGNKASAVSARQVAAARQKKNR